jgi:hypothetical protein
MGEKEVLTERELSVEEYLALFDPQSADHPLLAQRSVRLERILVQTVRERGRLFEDTTFIEKTGVKYTVRTVLEG